MFIVAPLSGIKLYLDGHDSDLGLYAAVKPPVVAVFDVIKPPKSPKLFVIGKVGQLDMGVTTPLPVP